MKKVVKRPVPYHGTAFHHLFSIPRRVYLPHDSRGAKSGARMKHKLGKDNKPI